jgi:hypothetical protein
LVGLNADALLPTEGGWNVLWEFWPDVKKVLRKEKNGTRTMSV